MNSAEQLLWCENPIEEHFSYCPNYGENKSKKEKKIEKVTEKNRKDFDIKKK